MTTSKQSLAPHAGDYLAYPAHSMVGLKTHAGADLPRGYLYVAAITPVVTAAQGETPSVTMAVYPAVFSTRANTFVRSTPRMNVTIPAAQFRAAFGRCFPIATLPNGLLKKTMKELFTRAGRAKDFPDVDYDRAFKAIAGKMFSKFPISGGLDDADKDDLILDTFLQVVTAKTIKDYDATKDPISYFGGMFQLRMTNELKSLVTQRVREVKNPNKPDSDLTDEEFFDLVDTRHQHVNPTTDEIDFKELTRELINHLKTKPEGKYFVPMFNMLAQGYSNKEVAEELKVSPAIVSRYLDRMKQAILEYARKSGNQLLYALMSEYLGKRKHAQDVFDSIVDVLKQYRKRVSGRAPAGKLTTVQRTPITNQATLDYMASVALDTERVDLADEALTQHFEALLEQDELVDRDPGTIVGLKVTSPR